MAIGQHKVCMIAHLWLHLSLLMCGRGDPLLALGTSSTQKRENVGIFPKAEELRWLEHKKDDSTGLTQAQM